MSVWTRIAAEINTLRGEIPDALDTTGLATEDYVEAQSDQGGETSREPVLTATIPNQGQGITTDGTWFYQGHDNGDGLNSDIRKVNPDTGAIVATWVGPPHASSVEFSPARGTILASSGAGEVPVIWEIDPTDGTQLRAWDFTSLNAEGILVAVDDTDATGNTVFVLTRPGAAYTFAVRSVTLNDDETWTDNGTLVSTADNGIAQGACGWAGKVYLLTDDPSGLGRRVSRFSRYGTTMRQDRTWVFGTTVEAQGVMFWRGALHYGDASGKLYRAPYRPFHDQVLTQEVRATDRVTLGPASAPVTYTAGVGSPEGVVAATPGSVYTRADGSQRLYVKLTGTGADGWGTIDATPVPVAATLLSDDYNRSDGAAGSAPTGQTYTSGTGATSTVASSRASLSTTAGVSIGWIADVGASDFVLETTILNASHLSSGGAFRLVDELNGYVVNLRGAYRLVSGATSSSGLWACYFDNSNLIPAGSRIRITVEGDTLSLAHLPPGATDWVAGGPIIGSAAADGVSMFNTATKIGLRSSSTAERWDDTTVKAIA